MYGSETDILKQVEQTVIRNNIRVKLSLGDVFVCLHLSLNQLSLHTLAKSVYVEDDRLE